MNLSHYIRSGIIEAYALGLTTPEEAAELEALLPRYPELKKHLFDFEVQLEQLAMESPVPPPPGNWEKIEDRLRQLPAIRRRHFGQSGNGRDSRQDYIPIQEASSSHIRVHKYWRAAFITVFILSKIFLILFIYFLIQYQHAQREVRQLRQQVEHPGR